MKRCPDCGYPNPDNLTNCFKCQTSLEPEPPSSPAQPPVIEPTPADPAVDDSQPINACPECGLTPESDEYSLPLCASYRTKMAYRPYPTWIIASTIAIVLVFAWAMIKFPTALRAGIAYERGQKAEEAGNYAAAADQYCIATQQYPDSILALARLTICQCKSDDVNGADATLSKLEGRKASEELVDEVNKAVKEASFRQWRLRHPLGGKR